MLYTSQRVDPDYRRQITLSELLVKSGDADFLRTFAESGLQIIMEADVEGLIGAAQHERFGERTIWREGYLPSQMVGGKVPIAS